MNANVLYCTFIKPRQHEHETKYVGVTPLNKNNGGAIYLLKLNVPD